MYFPILCCNWTLTASRNNKMWFAEVLAAAARFFFVSLSAAASPSCRSAQNEMLQRLKSNKAPNRAREHSFPVMISSSCQPVSKLEKYIVRKIWSMNNLTRLGTSWRQLFRQDTTINQWILGQRVSCVPMIMRTSWQEGGYKYKCSAQYSLIPPSCIPRFLTWHCLPFVAWFKLFSAIPNF